MPYEPRGRNKRADPGAAVRAQGWLYGRAGLAAVRADRVFTFWKTLKLG